VLGSSNLDTIPNLEELIACQEGLHGRDQRRNGHARGAFMPYSRHLGTKKKPKPGSGAGGQRAIKAAMSALARMHMVRLAQWQRYQMEMAVAPPTAGSSCGNQLQHVLSERKRREKLNDSFKALKTVLPPAPKVLSLLSIRFITSLIFLVHQLTMFVSSSSSVMAER